MYGLNKTYLLTDDFSHSSCVFKSSAKTAVDISAAIGGLLYAAFFAASGNITAAALTCVGAFCCARDGIQQADYTGQIIRGDYNAIRRRVDYDGDTSEFVPVTIIG